MYNNKLASIMMLASMYASSYNNRETDDCRKRFSFEKTPNKGLSAKEMGTAGKKKSKAARKKNKNKNKKRSA